MNTISIGTVGIVENGVPFLSRCNFSQMVSVCAVAVRNESTQTTAIMDLSIACFIEFKFWGLEYVLFMFCGVFFLSGAKLRIILGLCI